MKTCFITIVSSLLWIQSAFAGDMPTVSDVGQRLGFSPAEITQIKNGEIITQELAEGSDKELAGVVAVFFKRPLGELADLALEGKMLSKDPTLRSHYAWKPDEPIEKAFGGLSLKGDERKELELYKRAAPGTKLNLSDAEIARVRQAPDTFAAMRASLVARYESYRRSGLKGIASYARGGKKIASPSDELTLAIQETMPVARRPDYFKALLDYPQNPAPDLEHRFYWFKQIVENRPTFILAHRVSRKTDTAALLTEAQYYVSHSYNSNFIGAGALAVEGGTVVFYCNRTFTDQVAGMGSGLKHAIGRKQMLGEVAGNLRRIRGELEQGKTGSETP